jgi:hypothetical protein
MKQLLISIIGLTFSLAIVEIGLRILESRSDPAASSWSDRPAFYMRPEASATMQDYPITTPKPPGTFRLAVVGDSYSFAPYMQFTDAFPKVLERMLNLNAIPEKADVINYGVPAYSTSHEIATVERAIRDGADAILLQITLNDPEIKPYRPKGITVFNTFGQLEVTGWKKHILEHWHTAAFVVQRLHNEKTRRDYITYFNDLFNKKATWDNFESSMRTLVSTARDKQIPIVAAVFPLFGVPVNDSYPFMVCHDKTNALLTSLAVPHLDLLPLYRNIPIDRLQVIPGVDRHPNEIAHRMAAERLYTWLTDEQPLIPSQFHIRARFSDRTRIVDEPAYPPPTPSSTAQ